MQPGKGREARHYLQFIVDNYANLPATMVFLHAHETSWHMPDTAALLRRLRWGAVPFGNLRYAYMAGLEGVNLYPGRPEMVTWDAKVRAVSETFAELWAAFLGPELQQPQVRNALFDIRFILLLGICQLFTRLQLGVTSENCFQMVVHSGLGS